MRTTKIIMVSLLTTGVLCAQEKPADIAKNSDHAHHGGFMQGGMHHAMAKGVKLEQQLDGQTVTVRVGPIQLPAHTAHMSMPQPPDLEWQIPFDGWLLAYHPRLVDSAGNTVPGTVLHHTAFWNENRADFLCPNKEEHIFGAGSEMTDWAQVPGYGYRVQMGDKIRIETMVHNPTDTSYDNVYLEVAIRYQDAKSNANAPSPKDVYPAWMDVKSCGDSSYDIPAGPSERTGTVTVKYDGVLLGVGGHMHDYGKQVTLEDATHKETVAALDAKVDAQGHLESMPVKTFFEQGGYKFSAGDVLKISATYDNTSGKLLREGAMGIVVGYFVPADDSSMVSLRRKPKPAGHQMAGMAHDQ